MVTEAAKKMDTIEGPTGGVYLVVARKQGVALGVQLLGLHPGQKYGMPDHAWFGMKVRSAVDQEPEKPEDDGSNVVQLKALQPASPETAWGERRWDTKSLTTGGASKTPYCSLVTGILLPGDGGY